MIDLKIAKSEPNDGSKAHLISVSVIFVVSLFGLAITIIGFFPGWMSPDSLDQLSQAQTLYFLDNHPPLMTAWWSILLLFSTGPIPLLLQHTAMYWLGWAVFSIAHSRKSPIFSSLIPFLGFIPGPWLISGHIWKDVSSSTALFLFTAIVYYYSKTNLRIKKLVRVLLVLLLIYGAGVKLTPFVILPILFAYWIYVETKKKATFRRVVASSTLASITLIVPILGFNALVSEETNHFSQYIPQHDILAISIQTGENYFPTYLKDATKDIDLQSLYSPTANSTLFYLVPNSKADSAEELNELRSAWIKALVENPSVYLEHRWKVMSTQIFGGWVSPGGTVENNMGMTNSSGPITSFLQSLEKLFPIAFIPLVYFAVGLVSGFTAIFRRNKDSLFILAASVVLFIPHLFLLPAHDFRYFFLIYMYSAILFVAAVASFIETRVPQETETQ
jgi:hypothetical protein